MQNVLLRVIFSESAILGGDTWGGFLPPTLSHSLLVLHMRSILILPAVMLLSYRLYPTTTEALKHLLQPAQRPTLRLALMSSSFLYLAMALLFVAIASIPTGIATVLFFMHPVITGMLTWVVFGSRPSRLRLAVTMGVMLGSLLVVPSFAGQAAGAMGLGVGAALGASVSYATQGVQAQICFRHIHPVPFTLINFAVMAFWSTLSLFVIQIEVLPDQWGRLWGISMILAGLTLLGQLCYNIGIHLVRAASMSIVAVSNPMLTVTLAWLILHESLQGRQVLGIGLVVVSIVALSQDQTRNQSSTA
ncbi:MAG: DMT family transporter [Leptolyngbya sp.]|nr:DMT family transporter [Leptolyngbya sp.]